MNNELNLMSARLKVRGGFTQQERMIKDKRETLDRVTLYSYQGADVRKVGSTNAVKALINPNQVKQNYDDKIISIGYEHGFKTGTVFEWMRTGTMWLIYLQDLTELAYFLGDIRKCEYVINWENAEGASCSIYAAIRGPVETKINYIQKEGISIDTPNHSLEILMPKNKETLEYFTRYSKFYLKPLEDGDKPICWRIEATDTISMPGILQLTAVEYYANETEDDIDKGIVGGLVVETIPEPQSEAIIGETFIKPKLEYEYSYSGPAQATWEIVTKNVPIEIVSQTDNSITLKWNRTYTGQFVLKYGEEEKTIVVESLF